MPYVAATCPHCGGELKINTEMEKGYCSHCGSRIDFSGDIKEVNINIPIELEEFESYPRLYKYVEQALSEGTNQTEEFRMKLTKALELNPESEYLYNLVSSEVWTAEIENHVLISYKSNARKIAVPEGIVEIGPFAFLSCINLEEVILPRSLKRIEQGAFLYEPRLTISAYKDSFAAKYGADSPAKLNLIDYEGETKRLLQESQEILREIVVYKNLTLEKIEKYMNKAYSIRWIFVFVALLPVIYVFGRAFSTFSLYGLFVHRGAMAVSIIYAIVLILAVIMKTGYDEILRKEAIKIQQKRYIEKSNIILGRAGIEDFRYKNDLLSFDAERLEHEIKRIKAAKELFINLDLKDIFRKPKIQYTIAEYFQGKKPKGSK